MLQNNPMHFNPTFSCSMKPSFQFREKPLKVSDVNMNRRVGAIAALSLVLLAKDSFFTKLAYGFDFLLVAPDQTIEEAESGIIGHAQALLQVKQLIESESWGQLQTAVRKSSPLLKQDIYTIIQQKPGNERPLLRKLYSNLFNNVTRVSISTRYIDSVIHIRLFKNMDKVSGLNHHSYLIRPMFK